MVPVLVLLQLMLIHRWSKYRTDVARRLVLGGFVILPLLCVLQAVVVTDREQLVITCRQVAGAVQKHDLRGLAEFVSDDFQGDASSIGDGLDRSHFLDMVENLLNTYQIEEVRLTGFEVEVAGDRATVSYSSTCRVVTRESMIARVPSRWELVFKRESPGWRIVQIRPLPTQFFPYRKLSDIPR